MGYSYNFENNVLYGVEDVNNIVANFTSAGVNTYSDLNGISGALTEVGVTNAENSCLVADVSGGKIKIFPGIAFFYDGSTITVDSEGVILDAYKYVYFKKDPLTKKGYPVSSNTAPGTNDIPLAEYKNGILMDLRVRAVSKIQGFGTNVIYKAVGDDGEYFTLKGIPLENSTGNPTVTYKVGTIPVPNPERYTHMCMSDPYNTNIAYGKIGTEANAGGADYAYVYYTRTDGYIQIQNGGQTSFMCFGRDNLGKVYASFVPAATGFDLYFTVERNPPTDTLDIKWKIFFY